MSTNEKEVKRLLELKKLQEEKQVLDQINMQELMKLNLKFPNFASKNSKEMEGEMNEIGPLQQVSVKSDKLDLILEDYKNLYKKEPWYKEPETNDVMTFPSLEAVGEFFQNQASQNRSFMIFDAATNKVLGYSKGDGRLYNGNGTAFEGGKLQASEETYDKFKMPSPQEDLAKQMNA